MLEARTLTKYYDRYPALLSLDLTVARGEIVCLLGGNGAGKTTILHLFMGFIRPTSGTAAVDGRPVMDDLRETRRRLAYVPENVNLYPFLTGRENLSYFTRLAAVSKINEERLDDWLARVGLDPAFRDQRVNDYSKGMRQKVGLAIALAKNAKALLLDEPFSGLDPHAAHQFGERLRSLADDGVSVLMSTHDLFRSKHVGDRIGVMRSGQLVAMTSTADVSPDELEALYLRPHSEASSGDRSRVCGS